MSLCGSCSHRVLVVTLPLGVRHLVDPDPGTVGDVAILGVNVTGGFDAVVVSEGETPPRDDGLRYRTHRCP